jgi:hypothetical protein
MAVPPELAHLPGTELPEGAFTIDAEENRQLAEVLGTVPAADGTAHPAYCYIAAQRGIGLSVDDLLALADCRADEGPLLGSCELAFDAPLKVGTAYRVTGEVLSVERKQGRKTGAFDVLTFREDLVAPGGAAAASVTNVFILPRRES